MTDRPAAPSSRPAKHFCHWPGCSAGVPARLWGCTRHWNRLPAPIRKAISRAYRPGQEITKTPSAEYVEAARAAQTWILTGRLPSGRSELEPDALPELPPVDLRSVGVNPTAATLDGLGLLPPSARDTVPPDLSASAAIFDRLEAAAAPPRDCSAPCAVPFERPNFGGPFPPEALFPPGALESLRERGPETVLPRALLETRVPHPPPGPAFKVAPGFVPGGPIIDEEHVATFELRRQPAELPDDLDPEAPGLSPIQRIRRRRNLEVARDRMAAKIREAHDRTMGKLAAELFRQTIDARPVDPRGLDELGPRDVEVERLPHPAELEREAASILSADAERRRRAYVLGEFVNRTPEELRAEELERNPWRREELERRMHRRAELEQRRREILGLPLAGPAAPPDVDRVLDREAAELAPFLGDPERWLPRERPPIPLAELATSPPLGECAVCRRTAPLVDSECPDCRH